MSSKVTLRLPEPVIERLRERSRMEGQSLNETAVRVLLRGLGEAEPDTDWRALGRLVEVPPQKRYDPEEVRRRYGEIGAGGYTVDEDLNWVRGEC